MPLTSWDLTKKFFPDKKGDILMNEKIKEILKDYVDELADTEITDDMELISGGFIDSFDVINLIAEFESAFDVTVPLDSLAIERFETVADIAQVIRELQE
ncbi:MAG TPA: acyl carrier protein [Ruminococcus sp.]|nr:acyl carrier protein [Ruminococcus sp.]